MAGQTKMMLPSGGSITLTAADSAANTTLTLPNSTATLADLSSTQTLTNKTVTGYEQIVQGTAQATTSGTAVGFTGIPSWVKRITFIASNCTGSAVIPYIQLGSGSYTTTGYVSSMLQYNITTGAFYTASTSTAGFAMRPTGIYTFNLLSSSSNTWVMSGTSQLSGTDAGFGSGSITLSGTLDRIQIAVSSGTFTAGTVNILYEG